jgi:hypothetical protein
MKKIAFLMLICCVFGCSTSQSIELSTLPAIDSKQVAGTYWQWIKKYSISKLTIKENMTFEIVTQASPHSFSRGHYTMDKNTLTMVTDSFCQLNLDLKTGKKSGSLVKVDLMNDTTMVKNSLKLKQNWIKQKSNMGFCMKNKTLYPIAVVRNNDKIRYFIDENSAFLPVENGEIESYMVSWCFPK